MRPKRPLFLPIAFSLGARVENVPPREFLYNPTKICNALRQIGGYLAADGIACYFDATVEAEALGAELDWNTESGMPAIRGPALGAGGESGPDLARAEEVVHRARIPIACEVIRRLKAIGTKDRLLMAGVTGAFSLASGLGLRATQADGAALDLEATILEFAGSLVGEIATRYVEAGADIIFVVEGKLPTLSDHQIEKWASLLGPSINIVRFYEALPVLLFTDATSVAANRESLLGRGWDCVLCPNIGGLAGDDARPAAGAEAGLIGIAAPLELFNPGPPEVPVAIEQIRRAASELAPVVVTTAGDLPITADLRQASRILGELRQVS
jgi:uroporphyrinogen-III decarboxylase